ncbi:MAG: aldehyde dehydrogenase family protein, partial [Gemmatimonadota bacterium]|nr:aldehyde dehydrogenase family protein [Gemmatimonadota bacterium]
MTLPRIPHVVAGARHDAHSTRTAPVYDPSTGAVAAHVPLADAVDIETVIADAAAAAPAWGARSALDRARVLFRWRELCLAHADELARLISREHGKVVADARGELQRGLEVVEFA